MAVNPALLAMIKKGKQQFGKSSKVVSCKEGNTTLRVLVAPGANTFYAERGMHWIKTELNGKPAAVVGCRDVVHGEPCEVCTAIDRASKAVTDDESLKIVKDWNVKKTVLINALVRSGPDASETPQVVELKQSVVSGILSIMEQYSAHDIDILETSDFIVERIGKGFDTEYRVMVAPASKPVPAGTLEKLHDLSAWIEKEDFRGEERKALTAIANMTGISTSGLTSIAGPRPAAGLLTGPSGTVADAVVEEEVVAELEAAPTIAPGLVAAPKLPTTPAVKPVTAAAKPAAAVAKPAAAKPAAAAVVTPEAFGAALPPSEVDAMLAELDEVTA